MRAYYTVPAAVRFLILCVGALVLVATLAGTGIVGASSYNPSPVALPDQTQFASGGSSLPQTETVELKPGQTIERKIKGGETHAFSLRLAAGEYARLEVRWKGINLAARVTKPDEKRLFEFDTQITGPGATSLSIIADQTGLYKLVLSPSPEPQSVASGYELKLEDVRPPTPADNNRLAAERAMSEAQNQKSKDAAISKYEEAVTLWKKAEDAQGEANALRALANLYRTAGEFDNAEEKYKAALDLWEKKVNDNRGRAYLLLDRGAAYQRLNSSEDAIVFYTEALRAFQQLKDDMGVALSNYNLGSANAKLGRMSEALKFYEAAQKIYEAEGDSFWEARALNSMGGVNGVMGEHDEALKLYRRAVTLLSQLNDHYREGILINNMGVTYDDLGDWQQARESYDQSLSIYKSLKGDMSKVCVEGLSEQDADVCGAAASALDNIGELYNTLGNPGAALEIFKESLAIRRTLKVKSGIGTTLSRICYSTYLEGRYKDALASCQEALSNQVQPAEPGGQVKEDYRASYTYAFMGMIHSALNESEKAIGFYEKALKLQEKAGERRAQAIALDRMGSSYISIGNTKEASASYDRALGLWREIKDRDGEALTLYNMARGERERGNLAEAHRLIEQAIALVESLRVNITSKQLRAYYFASKVNSYELDIDLKMQLARKGGGDDLVADALQVNERARARSLLDMLTEARIEILPDATPELKRLMENRASIQRKLNDKTRALTVLLGGKYRKEQADAMAAEIDRLNLEYDETEARIKMQNPRYVALTKPQPLGLKEIQRELLDDRTLLLEYALGEQRSYLWVVSSTAVKWYELPKGAEIEEAARRFKQSITDSQRAVGETAQHYQARLLEIDNEYRQAATALSRMLLGQAGGELKDKRLLVVAEGELQSIPFGALYDPARPEASQGTVSAGDGASSSEPQPLVESHEIISLPSATTLAMIRGDQRKRALSKSVAILADPVFEKDDPRLMTASRTKGTGQRPAPKAPPLEQVIRDYALPRLMASRQEARDILAVIPSGTGLEALDFKASRATAMDPSLGQYRVVHFATHSLFNDEYPELSGIVLSLYDKDGRPQENGFLRLQDIYNLKLPVDLVVLSACRTGLGKNIRGEGLIGLTRGFMYAGAARVIASLWKVDDEATAELMKRFYQHLFRDGMTPAASLRAAQVSLREQRRWRAPYFWAGFVLQGDWK